MQAAEAFSMAFLFIVFCSCLIMHCVAACLFVSVQYLIVTRVAVLGRCNESGIHFDNFCNVSEYLFVIERLK